MSSSSQWRRGWAPEGPDPGETEDTAKYQITDDQLLKPAVFVSLNLLFEASHSG